jgi:hypothetical protein
MKPPQPIINTTAADAENLGNQLRALVLIFHRPNGNAAEVVHDLIGYFTKIRQPFRVHENTPAARQRWLSMEFLKILDNKTKHEFIGIV